MSAKRLPDQPNLEQLKKQAKDLLHGYQSGNAEAIAEVRQFERSATSSFALNDAQRVLARSYGFQSWPKLKAFVDGVNIASFALAVQEGDQRRVRSMLASRPELVAMDRAENDEHRALHYAVLRRDAEMVRLLMEAGADARKGIFPHRDATSAFALARDREYTELLAIMEEEERHRREEMSCANATVSPIQDQISAAIRQRDQATAIRLLEADLSMIHACDREGKTPLHLASGNGDVELVQWLLKRRANVHKKDPSEKTPLDYAASSAIAQMLLDYGAALTVNGAIVLGDLPRVHDFVTSDPQLLRAHGWTGGLLTLAVRHGQIAVAQLLLDLGADVDERILLEAVEEPVQSWGMPLWLAARRNDLEMARLLLDRGADPNANVYASGWPLGHAWRHEDGLVKQLLLERGAKPTAYMAAEQHDVAAARNLLAANAGEEVASELVWAAADQGCPEIVEMALEHLDWSAQDGRWHWVLIQPMRGAGADSAQNAGHFQSMAALLRHGIDPNVARRGHTALHFTAAREGEIGEEDRASFAAMLIDSGADLSRRDDLLKSTPLGWACRWGRLEMVKILLEKGAVVEEPGAEPWATPLAWATKMNHPSVIALLEAKRG
jgi:ankyrin repeat protein